MKTVPAPGPGPLTAEATWHRDLRIGHAVQLTVYGVTMRGQILKIAPNHLEVTIPRDDQSADVRRYQVTGSAEISLDGGAATVPVSARATGDRVLLQFIGPASVCQRRQHRRVRIEVPITIGWLAGRSGLWEHATSHTIDLSLGGVRVACARAAWPRAGTNVLVAMQLPQGTAQERAVTVGKTPEYDLRLTFVELDAITQGWIKDITG